MSDTITDNYQWVFSGIGVTAILVVAGVIAKTLQKPKADEKPLAPSPVSSSTSGNTITVTTNVGSSVAKDEVQTGGKINPDSAKKTNGGINYAKHILFIDDDVKFKIVSILRKAGWNNVSILKDISSLQCEEVLRADIIFVDIQGVGKQMAFKDQGLGLVQALKERYPAKKIVIYSAVSEWDPFKEGFRVADDRLSKNAEAYEFERTITELLQ